MEIGIRADRYKAMVPTVTGPLGLRGRVHAREARIARAHTGRRLKFTLPGPMTIIDTIADAHYGDRVAMAMAFAGLLNQEARALAADGVDVIQLDEPAFNVYMREVKDWGIAALHRAIDGIACTTAAHLLRLRHQGQRRLEGDARQRVAAVRGDLPGPRQPDRSGVDRMPQLARSDRPLEAARRQDGAGRSDRRCQRRDRDTR